MPSVTLTPDGTGNACLTVDGTSVATVSIGANGNVGVMLPSPDTTDVYVTRDMSASLANKGKGITITATHVTGLKKARPDIAIPIEDGIPTSPSPGAFPLIGQDDYLYDIMFGLRERKHMAIFGDTGCGKTASIEWLTALLNWNLVIVSITPGSNEDSFIGTQLPAAHEVTGAPTVAWVDRMIASAVRMSHERPTVVLLDEINRIRDVNEYASLMPLLDGTARLTLATGETIDKGDLVLVATANPPQEYVGTNELDPAFENRLPWTPSITYPAFGDEALALLSRVPALDAAVARGMAEVVSKIRKAGEITHPVGFRTLLMWAEAMVSGCYTWSESAERALVAKFPEDERQPVRNILAMWNVDDAGLPVA